MSGETLKLVRVSKDVAGYFTLEADFEVAPGERLGIVGRSGAGKSTLLRLIAGLERTDQGRIVLGETELTAMPPERRRIGFVFQEQALFPAMSVLENVAFPLKMQGVPREERQAIAGEWLDKVDLLRRAGEDVNVLSGGERQRIAFVRALCWKPRALLLDEPFSALDSVLRNQLRTELKALHALWPVPLVLVTHDEADLDALATRRIACVEDQGHRTRRFSS